MSASLPRHPPTDRQNPVAALALPYFADVVDEAASLREDVVRYRELLSAALRLLHDALERERQHRDRTARLVDELRRLRRFLMAQDAA
jgi:hypothetical protein